MRALFQSSDCDPPTHNPRGYDTPQRFKITWICQRNCGSVRRNQSAITDVKDPKNIVQGNLDAKRGFVTRA